MKSRPFDLLSANFKNNPLPMLAALREAGPLVELKMPIIGRFRMVTHYDAVCHVLRDHHHFVQQAGRVGRQFLPWANWLMPRIYRVLSSNMLLRDEPDHRRLRSLVEQAFLRRSVADMRPRIEQIADEMLDAVDHVARRDGSVDLMAHFARPFPLAVICELLGLPSEDRPMFLRWGQGMRVASMLGLLRGLFSVGNIHGYLRGQFRRYRTGTADTQRAAGSGLIPALVAAEEAGDRLNEDELLAMAFLLLFAGHETTTHLIGTGLLALLDFPDARHALAADESLAESTVEEVLRYMSPVQMTKPRYALHNLELFGQPLRRGEMLIGSLAAANHDPQQFAEPQRFDIRRHPNRHLTFGTGIHICLGAQLARVEAQVALLRLLNRFPQLALAAPRDALQWGLNPGIRALKSLPLRLHPAAGHG